ASSLTTGVRSGAISGYWVGNLRYVLNQTTPRNIDSLTFRVAPRIPSTSSGRVDVRATLSKGGPKDYSCMTDAGGTTIACATTSPQLTTGTLSGLVVVPAA